MAQKKHIVAVIGPTASGKSDKAIEIALERNGEIISVDSRQVYRTLDIGTEKLSESAMRGVPHHLIDIREPEKSYNAGDFAKDATELIDAITARGKVPILAGGTHFYFDALLNGLPADPPIDPALRESLEQYSLEELFARLQSLDPARARSIDFKNKRRLVRALELVSMHGKVPVRTSAETAFDVEWTVIDVSKEILRQRIDARFLLALERGLIEETRQVRERVGDKRLNEFGLEYRVVGEYLRGERDEDSLVPTLSTKLWHYARRQKAWLKRLPIESDTIPS